ncbi:MAG: 2-C-methyl-D-erythritol 2,4-cyclodiphosphate synthase [Thermotogales bacterium 46_20]|nr:MAG: 2-C-methyl-D-erythritol 2,4-cyclodiphosphate synthase [Thermotogales bacterium 46_20]
MLSIGYGFDAHVLEEGGEGLVIGGVVVSREWSPKSHSDGDALVHAIIDALLGASGLGNIGELFPENEKNRGRYSVDFLVDVGAMLHEARLEVVNLDSVVILENVTLTPYLEEMKRRVSSSILTSKSAISIKPKSGNGLYPGQVVAHAVCLVGK